MDENSYEARTRPLKGPAPERIEVRVDRRRRWSVEQKLGVVRVPMSARYVVAGANLMNAPSRLAAIGRSARAKSELDPNNGQSDT
jgi:hypothetical protein